MLDEPRPLRAGVIGLGVGARHADGYDAHPRCTVTALCDRDPARREEAAGRWPGARVCAEAGEVLDDPAIDVVSIATYDDAHADQIERAIRAGKHVFAEKPMCLDAAEARRLRAALAARPEVRVSSNLVLRRSPRMRELRRLVRCGVLGRPFHVHAAYNYGRLHKLTEGWRGRQPRYSVTLGGAVHVVDLLLWVTGDRVVEVAAAGNNIASAEAGFARPDLAAALLRCASGLTAVVTANFGCVMPHHHALEVHGTAGTFVQDAHGARVYGSRDPDVPPAPVTEPHPGASKGELVEGFVESIVSGRPCEVSIDETFEALAVCFAIERALEQGGCVAVEAI